jgi:hypothetical protein
MNWNFDGSPKLKLAGSPLEVIATNAAIAAAPAVQNSQPSQRRSFCIVVRIPLA